MDNRQDENSRENLASKVAGGVCGRGGMSAYAALLDSCEASFARSRVRVCAYPRTAKVGGLL